MGAGALLAMGACRVNGIFAADASSDGGGLLFAELDEGMCFPGVCTCVDGTVLEGV